MAASRGTSRDNEHAGGSSAVGARRPESERRRPFLRCAQPCTIAVLLLSYSPLGRLAAAGAASARSSSSAASASASASASPSRRRGGVPARYLPQSRRHRRSRDIRRTFYFCDDDDDDDEEEEEDDDDAAAFAFCLGKKIGLVPRGGAEVAEDDEYGDEEEYEDYEDADEATEDAETAGDADVDVDVDVADAEEDDGGEDEADEEGSEGEAESESPAVAEDDTPSAEAEADDGAQEGSEATADDEEEEEEKGAETASADEGEYAPSAAHRREARTLRTVGKELHDSGNLADAASTFRRAAEELDLAIGLLSQLDAASTALTEVTEEGTEIHRRAAHASELDELSDERATCVLHEALCRLKLGDHAGCVESCTDVLGDGVRVVPLDGEDTFDGESDTDDDSERPPATAVAAVMRVTTVPE
eukprot:CAMPEP_0113559106 /NCGR_PEP_ID=MMETSP0015_2-20120614/18713_1 /TAXON_ID=2838 /ORGANISM="Odontella" /LENGTH=418 /DNA_ID=CAMNT_0000460707 /DNA_START=233 /DNA_END=1486 /DNA_ORIENTATION=+ /assembly_acc=CAM_ASM_000160